MGYHWLWTFRVFKLKLYLQPMRYYGVHGTWNTRSEQIIKPTKQNLQLSMWSLFIRNNSLWAYFGHFALQSVDPRHVLKKVRMEWLLKPRISNSSQIVAIFHKRASGKQPQSEINCIASTQILNIYRFYD